MAKKKKRRQFRRPRPQQRSEDANESRRRLEVAAESLLTTRTAEQLSRELSEREWLLAEADRAAQLEPSPANLSRYRFAQSQYETAQAAVRISSGRSSDLAQEPATAG